MIKRSLAVGRHRTSVSLEDAFWYAFQAIARERRMPLSQLVSNVDADRQHSNLSSAIRVFVFDQRCNPFKDAQPQNKPPRDSADSAVAKRGPDDQSRTGSFQDLSVGIEFVQRPLVQRLRIALAIAGKEDQRAGDFLAQWVI